MRMTDYNIVFTHKAQKDIKDIRDYISCILLEPEVSKNFTNGLKSSIFKLKYFPFGFPLIQNIHTTEAIRCMPYKNYYVFYTISDENNVITIIRIGYKRRNWIDILK